MIRHKHLTRYPMTFITAIYRVIISITISMILQCLLCSFFNLFLHEFHCLLELKLFPAHITHTNGVSNIIRVILSHHIHVSAHVRCVCVVVDSTNIYQPEKRRKKIVVLSFRSISMCDSNVCVFVVPLEPYVKKCLLKVNCGNVYHHWHRSLGKRKSELWLRSDSTRFSIVAFAAVFHGFDSIVQVHYVEMRANFVWNGHILVWINILYSSRVSNLISSISLCAKSTPSPNVLLISCYFCLLFAQ